MTFDKIYTSLLSKYELFFENKDLDIKDLKKMIKNPDPSKVKEYGGGSKYKDMLKNKLAKLENNKDKKDSTNIIENNQVKVRKGGASKAFYTGTRVEKDKKKEKLKKAARSKVKSEDSEDRCKRKADSVYGKKTSAYKSGAIVRCRKGKIWKK